MSDLEDQHRIFLQAFMFKKMCDFDEVKILHQKCHDTVDVAAGDLQVFIQKINCALKPLNMAINKGVDELTEKDYYILVNGNNNSISRLAQEYTVQELEVYKSILTSIVKSDDGRISSTDALNLETDFKTSKKELNDMLRMFIKDGWLCEKDGYYFFSTRAIAELQHFFRENYPEHISDCFWCKKIVFQGTNCENCDTKIHNSCFSKFLGCSKTGLVTCRACKGSFNSINE